MFLFFQPVLLIEIPFKSKLKKTISETIVSVIVTANGRIFFRNLPFRVERKATGIFSWAKKKSWGKNSLEMTMQYAVMLFFRKKKQVVLKDTQKNTQLVYVVAQATVAPPMRLSRRRHCRSRTYIRNIYLLYYIYVYIYLSQNCTLSERKNKKYIYTCICTVIIN